LTLKTGVFLTLLVGDSRTLFQKENGFNQASPTRYSQELLREKVPELKSFLRQIQQAVLEVQVRISELEKQAKWNAKRAGK